MKYQKKKIPYETKLPVYFTQKELKLIREETLYNTDFGNIGIFEKGKTKIELSLDDIEEIQGYVAAEANHTENKKQQKELDKIFNKFQWFLNNYDDQED